jgi:hypothetical protein
VAAQATFLGAIPGARMFTTLGFDKAYLDKLSACVTSDLSTRYGYDYITKCNANVGSAGCKAAPDDFLSYLRCMGGGEKGKWTDEMKAFLRAAPANAGETNADALKVWPCIVEFLSERYSFLEAYDEVNRTAALDRAAGGTAVRTPIYNAGITCRMNPV